MLRRRIPFTGSTYVRKKIGALATVLALAVASFGLAAQADETYSASPNVVYTLRDTTTAGNPTNPLTGFDISFVDNAAGVFTLSDSSNAAIDKLDLNDPRQSGATLTVIQPTNASCTLPSSSLPDCAFQGAVSDPNAANGGIHAPYNDVSGPTGNMIVNHREIWADDAASFNGPIVAGSYANDECNSSVKIIDLRTEQVTDVVNLGGCFRSDELSFDPADQVALIANPSETDCTIAPCPPGAPKVNFITLVSTKPDHKILERIYFDGRFGTPNAVGGIEQSRWNPQDGMFYVAVPADGGNASGAIAVIDPRSGSAVRKIELSNNCSPAGMFIGPNQDAVLGCGNGPVQVVDLTSGRIDASITQVPGGCDEVWYDRGENHYVVACSAGTPGYVAGVIDAGDNGYPIAWEQNIPTQVPASGPPPSGVGGASHSIAADNFTNRILVPMGARNPNCGDSASAGCIGAWVAPGDADDAPPPPSPSSRYAGGPGFGQ